MKNGEKRGGRENEKKRKKGLKLHSIELIGSKIFEGGSRPPLHSPCVNCMQLAHLLLEEKNLVSLKTKKKFFYSSKTVFKTNETFMSFSKEPKININIHGRISGQTGYLADRISGQISNSTINVSKQHIII